MEPPATARTNSEEGLRMPIPGHNLTPGMLLATFQIQTILTGIRFASLKGRCRAEPGF